MGIDWDAKLGIVKLLQTYVEPKVIAEYYPGGIFGFDKEGSPVVYQQIGFIDFKGLLYSVRTDEILKSRALLAEKCIQLCQAQSEKLGTPITGVTLVYDLEGLGMKHLWRPGVKLFNTISSLFEERYPTLPKRILVIRSGRLFPVAYAIAKPFLSEDTKKKIVVCRGDWKTELQQYIDPAEVPEYYGGTCKDPDGDPMCRSKICYGGEVPASYYVSRDEMSAEGMERVTVPSGQKHTIQKEVQVPGTVIQWEFKTSQNDIGFSLSLQSRGSAADGTYTSSVILPFDKKQSHLVPEESMVTCEKPGTYFIVFDNSYSWTRSKDLYYRITMHEPENESL